MYNLPAGTNLSLVICGRLLIRHIDTVDVEKWTRIMRQQTTRDEMSWKSGLAAWFVVNRNRRVYRKPDGGGISGAFSIRLQSIRHIHLIQWEKCGCRGKQRKRVAEEIVTDSMETSLGLCSALLPV